MAMATTTTSTTAPGGADPSSSSGLTLRSIVDDEMNGDDRGVVTDDGFSFSDPGGTDGGEEEAAMTGLEQMDMDSILQHFLNMG